MNYGFFKVASVVPQVNVADVNFNTESIIVALDEAASHGASLVAFPELSVTGYTCADLFAQTLLLDAVEEALHTIADATLKCNATVIVGAPLRCDNALYNCAVVMSDGEIVGVVPKTYLPNYKEFYEKRWFQSGSEISDSYICIGDNDYPFGSDLLFTINKTVFGIEICEDMWTTIPPSSVMALNGANLIVNISASNEVIGKHAYLRELISQQSARCISGYVYSSCGYGESTTDVVFAGNAIVAENGAILTENKRFENTQQISYADIDIERVMNERRVNVSFGDASNIYNCQYRNIECKSITDNAKYELDRVVNPHPFVPSEDVILNERCEEILNIQVYGLMRRLQFTKIPTAVIGISGGLDSTLALLVCVRAFDRLGRTRKDIIGVTMPGFGTTDRTYNNAIGLMKSLGITIREISIADAVMQHFHDIGHDSNIHNITYENSQARERTQILMDISNQTNGLVVGTGDLSELALGWATYNGDHMSMYGVNVSIPKTLVKYLVRWEALNNADDTSRDILLDVVDTPISPELLPADADGNIAQKTEDSVGPYELHDFFLYYMMRFGFAPDKILFLAKKAFSDKYDIDTIKKWLKTFYRRFFIQQFKRSCLPDGPKVGSISISPRGDWRMPSDATSALWLQCIDKM